MNGGRCCCRGPLPAEDVTVDGVVDRAKRGRAIVAGYALAVLVSLVAWSWLYRLLVK